MSVSSRLRGETPKTLTTPSSIDTGDKYVCIWKSGQKFPAEVVAKRRKEESNRSNDTNDGLPSDYEYYVHYINFDRRLDEWISIERFDFQTNIDNDTNTNKKRTKRKFDEEKDDKEHSSAIVTAEQEHEEITKVKNIQSISFGRYDVETWYFSPS